MLHNPEISTNSYNRQVDANKEWICNIVSMIEAIIDKERCCKEGRIWYGALWNPGVRDNSQSFRFLAINMPSLGQTNNSSLK